MPNTICIIQARRQSERLPDKIFLPLGGKPVLQHVIERCQQIQGVSHVVVASPSDPHEDEIEQLSLACGAQSYRGDMNDVLSRYWGAYRAAPAPLVMRVTADCPLLDPSLCTELLAKMAEEKAQYAGLGGWPHGMECEVFTEGLLKRTHQEASDPLHREHVTLWMKSQNGIRRTSYCPIDQNFRSDNRWVVDYPEDYKFMKELFALFPDGQVPASWQDILAIVDAHPGIREINRACEADWNTKTQKIYRETGQNWTPA